MEEQGKAYEVALRAKQEKKRLAREVGLPQPPCEQTKPTQTLTSEQTEPNPYTCANLAELT